VLIKAANGGGGRGMRIVNNPEDFKEMVDLAALEAGHIFGNPSVFAEQYIARAKHIEVQVVGDRMGNLIHLFERECTIQRRYQKIIEESPSPSLTESQRKAILNDAVILAGSVGYDSTGTLEFLLAPDGKYYFLEMNTRIQVEHPVTEMVTGIDLVVEQIRVASGAPLSIRQEDISSSGHAIECRICAENPAQDFNPEPGLISLFKAPAKEGVRTDHAIGNHFVVSPVFDSMIAKVIALDADRPKALMKIKSALKDITIHGVNTNQEYLLGLIDHQNFSSSVFFTDFTSIHSSGIVSRNIEKKEQSRVQAAKLAFELLTCTPHFTNHYDKNRNPWSHSGSWRVNESRILEYNGKQSRFEPNGDGNLPKDGVTCSIHPDRSLWITFDGNTFRFTEPSRTRSLLKHALSGKMGSIPAERNIYAPLPGLLTRLMVKEGDPVLKGDPVAIIESMKIENMILADTAGKIGPIMVSIGKSLRLNELIMEIYTN